MYHRYVHHGEAMQPATCEKRPQSHQRVPNSARSIACKAIKAIETSRL
jgi:hypothetical protein